MFVNELMLKKFGISKREFHRFWLSAKVALRKKEPEKEEDIFVKSEPLQCVFVFRFTEESKREVNLVMIKKAIETTDNGSFYLHTGVFTKPVQRQDIT